MLKTGQVVKFRNVSYATLSQDRTVVRILEKVTLMLQLYRNQNQSTEAMFTASVRAGKNYTHPGSTTT